ncbi:MAG: hypothetical protein K2J80_03400 [Oscillospiraceae bacterium]|nr:hypothetical protein [Oscillospiraceae bacterium]
MKKVSAIILTIISRLLLNAGICAAGVFAFPAHFVIYIIAAATLISIYSPILIAVVGNVADKSRVSRKTLYLCAQAPILALSLAYFIVELFKYDPPYGGGILSGGGWAYVGNLGLGLGIAMFMLITSVLTTSAAFITAAVVKRKGLDQ